MLWFSGSWELLGGADLCNYGSSGVHRERRGQVSDWALRRKGHRQRQQENELPGDGPGLRPVQVREGEWALPGQRQSAAQLFLSYLLISSIPATTKCIFKVKSCQGAYSFVLFLLLCIHTTYRDIYVNSCCVPSHSFFTRKHFEINYRNPNVMWFHI